MGAQMMQVKTQAAIYVDWALFICVFYSGSGRTWFPPLGSSLNPNKWYQSQRNPYSNTYNPGWRDHPNLSWSNQTARQEPPGFVPQENKSNLQELMTKFISTYESRFNNVEASVRNLEIHMEQLANMVSGRVHGTLPSDTEKNPKEHVKTITLRNDKKIGEQEDKSNEAKK
ncbi:hypothetical protein AKJ16_DCAP11232 [Drosera capensis]